MLCQTCLHHGTYQEIDELERGNQVWEEAMFRAAVVAEVSGNGSGSSCDGYGMSEEYHVADSFQASTFVLQARRDCEFTRFGLGVSP